ncbi:hypothetical protein [Streptomyces sp. NPDC002463]|uniref:hypothetical protein n=1 Tax=Streptomyces sp. NPDC002463 TaxID=3364645 RepID=UPI00368741D3
MDYPSDLLREDLQSQPYETEDDCANSLQWVAAELEKQPPASPYEEPSEALAAAEGWAALTSYVVARTYAPQSPMRYAGWVRIVALVLQRIAAMLRARLMDVVTRLGASGLTVSVAFPWGLSVALEWSV